MRRFEIFLLTLFLALPGVASADIIIDGFTDATNDRFSNPSPDPNTSSFIAAGFDLSGIGRGAGNAATGSETPTQTRWATLLSRNVVITANHFPARETNVNKTLSFYRNNDSNDEIVRTLVSSQRIGQTDLYLSVLDSAVPADIAVYGFVNEVLNAPPFDENTNNQLYNAGTLQGAEAYLFGISPTVRDDSETRIDQAVGRNKITGYIEDLDFNGSDNDILLLARDAAADADFVQYEARFSGGDSGAPLFIESNGEFMLLGVNSVLLTGTPQFSGVAYIGNHTTDINAFIQANAVPEPSAAMAIGFLVVGLIGRRRRSKN